MSNLVNEHENYHCTFSPQIGYCNFSIYDGEPEFEDLIMEGHINRDGCCNIQSQNAPCAHFCDYGEFVKFTAFFELVWEEAAKRIIDRKP